MNPNDPATLGDLDLLKRRIDRLVFSSLFGGGGSGAAPRGASALGVKAAMAVSQTLSVSGLAAIIVWGAEEYDDGNLHSLAAPTRLTAPVDGKYQIILQVLWAPDAGGFPLSSSIRKNGTTSIAFDLKTSTGAAGTTQFVITEDDFVAGEYIEAELTQTTGGPLAVVGANTYGSFFFMRKMAD